MAFTLLINIGAAVLAILAIYGFFVLARAYTKTKAAEAAASTNKILRAEIDALQISRDRLLKDFDDMKKQLAAAEEKIAELSRATNLEAFRRRSDLQWEQTMMVLIRIAAKVLDEPITLESL